VQNFTNVLLNIPSGVEIATSTRSARGISAQIGEAKGATANTTDWGTDRTHALELIEDALNLKTPTVYDTVDKSLLSTRSPPRLRAKSRNASKKNSRNGWSDDSRRERLCRLYNDTFNHTRVRTFNGDHLTLPGASGAIQLHSHKRPVSGGFLQTPNTCWRTSLARQDLHDGLPLRWSRAGLVFRQADVCRPNHMLGQFSTELLTLYPGANILAAGKEDFESQNRKKLFSRIATGIGMPSSSPLWF